MMHSVIFSYKQKVLFLGVPIGFSRLLEIRFLGFRKIQISEFQSTSFPLSASGRLQAFCSSAASNSVPPQSHFGVFSPPSPLPRHPIWAEGRKSGEFRCSSQKMLSLLILSAPPRPAAMDRELEPKGYAENGSPTDSLHLISQLRYVVRLT